MERVIAKRIEELIGNGVTVEETTVTKNNGVVKRAFVLHDGSNLSPTVYYQDDRSEEENIEMMVSLFKTSEKFDIDFSKVLTKSFVLDNVIPVLISKERNTKLLESSPHTDFLDLAIIYELDLTELGGKLENATIKLNNNHLDYLGITLEELRENAKADRKGMTVRNIFDYLNQIYCLFDENFEKSADVVPMWVISNKSGLYGASIVTDKALLAEISEKLELETFIVFPSSVHEVIVIADTPEASAFAPMVREINETEVAEQDFLSNSVYRYNGTELTIV